MEEHDVAHVEGIGSRSRTYSSRARSMMVFLGIGMLLLLVPLGYFALSRPVLVFIPDLHGVHVQNEGRMDALVHRVDAFWFWAGEVALVTNLPSIHQQVSPGAPPLRLQVPQMPTPVAYAGQEGPWYMKMVVRYRIPGIPVFRYTSLLHFFYDEGLKRWIQTHGIPPKYRSLGKLGIGDVNTIKLDFHE